MQNSSGATLERIPRDVLYVRPLPSMDMSEVTDELLADVRCSRVQLGFRIPDTLIKKEYIKKMET